MSRRPPNFNVSANPTTAQTLALLSEYTHVLDSLPLDLSRNFADLRELDAVLSSSMAVLTYKIKQLTVMIEANSGSKEERLWLLIDIAEEAARLKLGGEDKIRVACHAADGLRGHRAYMKALLERAPDGEFEAVTDLLARKTVYPHVATRQYLPPGMVGEGGRRNRRGAYGSLLVHAAGDASPNKRKRAAVRDEDGEVLGKTPRKERAGDNLHAPRQRNGARSKKTTDRAASPTESLLSVASHLPQSHLQTQLPASNPRQNVSARAGSNAS
ncbi:hypothetical protein A0H81_01397 [Grifola frondosa]|uniref:Inhibitor of growth protein N-terminal histone-binding domain-containing protein n=1 Tax=Grifola frondosa TaxID=5627 RepID=A0A1C7MQT5_GRIFR|nr:hypothetical protein A0H81_01397 [Grifola frondosa]